MPRPKGCKQTLEARAKISATKKLQCASAEFRSKMSVARRKRLADPAQRAELVEKLRDASCRAWANPEIRARRSAAMRAGSAARRAARAQAIGGTDGTS